MVTSLFSESSSTGIASTQVRYWGFSPHRGDLFHGLLWNLAQPKGPVPSAVQNFTLTGPYLGVSGPNTQSITKFANFVAKQERLLDFGKIYSVYAGFCSVEVFKIWGVSDYKSGIYRQKTIMGQISPIFLEPPSAKTTDQIWKSLAWCKNGTDILSACKVWWRSRMRHAHSKGYIVIIHCWILMQFSSILKEDTAFLTLCILRNTVASWRHKCR